MHEIVKPNSIIFFQRREQAVEKKYPGTYKRHLVRPIVRSNAVEKLIKKKGSMSHKPGMPQPKRYNLLTAVRCSKKLQYYFTVIYINISCLSLLLQTVNTHNVCEYLLL